MIENKSKEATSTDSTSKTEDSFNLEKLRDIISSEIKFLTPNYTSTQFKEKAPQFISMPNQQSGYRPYNNGSYKNTQYNYTRPQRGSSFFIFVVNIHILKPTVHKTKPNNKKRNPQTTAMIITVTARV